jgi:hypothetical protein
VGRFLGTHRVRDYGYAELQLNKGYDQMRDAVGEAMRADQELHGWIRKSAPAFLRKARKSAGKKKRAKK